VTLIPFLKPQPWTNYTYKTAGTECRGLYVDVALTHRYAARPLVGIWACGPSLPARCRGASYPCSRPDFSRRLEPALKPLFSRAVRTVASRRLLTFPFVQCRDGCPELVIRAEHPWLIF